MYTLDPIDRKILRVIESGDMHSSEIARRIRIPRTTVAHRLKKLSEHGRAQSRIDGRKRLWSFNSVVSNEGAAIESFLGEQFVDIYLELLHTPKESVVFSVQGVAAGEGEIMMVGRSVVERLHKQFKKKQIVFKSITNSRILDVFNDLDSDYIASHVGRGGGVQLVDGNQFMESGEVFVSEKIVIIANPSKKIGIVIRDRALVLIYYQLFSLLFDNLGEYRLFKLNDYLKKKL